jgi:hypothetical protein
LLFPVRAAIVEFERDLIRDRVIAGIRGTTAGATPSAPLRTPARPERYGATVCR